MGRLSEGTEIRVTVSSDSTCSGNLFIAAMNNDALNAAVNAMGTNQWNVTEYGDGHFKGTISAPDSCVMFTSIPYSDGWKVTVDGQRADTIRIGDALLGVYLTKGDHTVTMNYSAPGFPLGIILTLAGIALLVLWCLRKKAVYPLLKEFVPLLSMHIEEMKPDGRDSQPHEDEFGEESADRESEDRKNAGAPVPPDAVSAEPVLLFEGGEIKQRQPESRSDQPQPAQPKPQPAQPKPHPAQPKPQPVQPKPQPVQPKQPERQNLPDRPAVLTEQHKSPAQPKPPAHQNIPDKPAVLTEQPAHKQPIYSTGEVFEITEDNKSAKK